MSASESVRKSPFFAALVKRVRSDNNTERLLSSMTPAQIRLYALREVAEKSATVNDRLNQERLQLEEQRAALPRSAAYQSANATRRAALTRTLNSRIAALNSEISSFAASVTPLREAANESPDITAVLDGSLAAPPLVAAPTATAAAALARALASLPVPPPPAPPASPVAVPVPPPLALPAPAVTASIPSTVEFNSVTIPNLRTGQLNALGARRSDYETIAHNLANALGNGEIMPSELADAISGLETIAASISRTGASATHSALTTLIGELRAVPMTVVGSGLLNAQRIYEQAKPLLKGKGQDVFKKLVGGKLEKKEHNKTITLLRRRAAKWPKGPLNDLVNKFITAVRK